MVNDKYPKAEKLLKGYIEKYSHSEKILLTQYYLGDVTFQRKKYDKAIPLLIQMALAGILEVNPKSDRPTKEMAMLMWVRAAFTHQKIKKENHRKKQSEFISLSTYLFGLFSDQAWGRGSRKVHESQVKEAVKIFETTGIRAS